MQVLIFQPAKTAMQSGSRNAKRWRLVFEESDSKFIDPLMGWVGERDTMQQPSLQFDSREEAVAYAQHKALSYMVIEKDAHQVKPSSYADNFRFDRIKAW